MWRFCSHSAILFAVGLLAAWLVVIAAPTSGLEHAPILHDKLETLIVIWSALLVVWILGLPIEFRGRKYSGRHRALWIGFVFAAWCAY